VIMYVTGILGAGKSYYGARKIADALLRGKVVITNMQLVPGWEKLVLSHSPYYKTSKKKESFEREIRSRYAFEPDIEFLVSATIRGKGESRGIRVIDEAHNEINNRAWMAENQKTILKRMALARKRGWDDYILAQHRDNTDMSMRRISGVEVKLINWRQILEMPFFHTKLLPFNLFLAMAFPMNNHLRKEKKVLWRELYGLGWQKNIYDTFEDFDHRNNVEELEFRDWVPRLPVPDGYDTVAAHALKEQRDYEKALRDGEISPILPDTGEANTGEAKTREAQVPFKPSVPTVSAKGIDRADVLDLLANLPLLADGEFATDEQIYQTRAEANAIAAKYVRVAESIDSTVSLRSRTWEAPEGGGWYFGIRRKEDEETPVPVPIQPAAERTTGRRSQGRSRSSAA